MHLSLSSLCDKTIIEWFLSIHWIIFCENLQYQPSGRRPRGWYCKFSQNIIQCILRNHSIIVYYKPIIHRLYIINCQSLGDDNGWERFLSHDNNYYNNILQLWSDLADCRSTMQALLLTPSNKYSNRFARPFHVATCFPIAGLCSGKLRWL